jgi:hypothetical protein
MGSCGLVSRYGGNWRALVNMLMKFHVPQIWGIYGLAEQLFSSQEELCYIELVS